MRVPITSNSTELFKGIDIISTKNITRNQMNLLFKQSTEIEKEMNKNSYLNRFSHKLEGRTLGNLFYEPSTRTRLSFESAMKKLGGNVVGFDSSEGASVRKGESLADTVRTIEKYYTDIIVLRHPLDGSAQLAAEFVDVPLINGGDGSNEHPTQTLLDLYSIWKNKGRIDGLNMALVGDLKFGRTVHSLSYALPLFKINKLFLVSPDMLRMQREYSDFMKEKIETEEYREFREILPELDVLYMTRIQKERFHPSDYEKVKGCYQLTKKDLEQCKKDMIILHPLPRVDEIAPEVDRDKRALYFNQMQDGMIVRMALLYLMLG